MDQTRSAGDALSRAPILMSLTALALVVATAAGATGAYPARDEGWQAHVFQLLIVLQLPIILLNVVAGRRSRAILVRQSVLLAAAIGSIALVG